MVILTDVSGSMDRYARFVIPFLLGLKGIGSRAEAFVFSTSLTHITNIIHRFPISTSLERIAQVVPDWSGGTRIGFSLRQFIEGYGRELLHNRAVVVIMSDGWDLGGRELLKRSMEKIHRKAFNVIWLNPLAGDARPGGADDGSPPLSKGMQAALPYVDHFLAVNSLQSLKRIGHVLSTVMANN